MKELRPLLWIFLACCGLALVFGVPLFSILISTALDGGGSGSLPAQIGLLAVLCVFPIGAYFARPVIWRAISSTPARYSLLLGFALFPLLVILLFVLLR